MNGDEMVITLGTNYLGVLGLVYPSSTSIFLYQRKI